MPEVLLTVYCSRPDAAAVAAVLRDVTRHPVHQRDETVYGFDFSDASTAERVTGQLDRCTVEVRVDEDAAQDLIDRIGATKRAGPVRWRLTPVLASGRFA